MLMSVALPTMVACGSDDEEEEETFDTSKVSLFREKTKTIEGNVISAVLAMSSWPWLRKMLLQEIM